MFDYVTGSDTMDKGAGMKVCGWNIHNCNRDVMGGLSSTMEDALLGKSKTDKELDWEKMNALMGQLFPKSDLDPAIFQLLFSSILQFWPAFVKDCDSHLNGQDTYYIKFVQKACSNANISYKNIFLKWANDSRKNFQAKNIAGLLRLSLDDLRKTEAVDGRNLAFFLESIGKILDLHTKEHKSVCSDLKQAAKLVKLNLKK